MRQRTWLRWAGVLVAGALSVATLAAEAGADEATLAARSASCATTTLASPPTASAIPDPGSVDSTVTSSVDGFVAAAQVTVNVAHPFDSDLQVKLVSPAGTAVTLADAVGTWGRDFSGTVFSDDAPTSVVSSLPPFAGRVRPVQPLGALTGSGSKGTWTLRVTDRRAGYAGELDGWTLALTACDAVAAPPTTAGAAEPPPLPVGVPAGLVPVVGRPVTVTTAADAVNGDVSSVAALQASPGPDGISLREAITATNADRAPTTIRFAPSLRGATIQVGSFNGQPLPALTGGDLLIDGDVDGDGGPDVTLSGAQVSFRGSGLAIASSGNRLHALAVTHFPVGVSIGGADPYAIQPSLPTGAAFSGNTVDGLVMSNVTEEGVQLFPYARYSACVAAACATHNTWSDIRLVGNTITSGKNGIDMQIAYAAGDTVEAVTVAGNTISAAGGFGVDLAAGGGAGADQNRISDAEIAYNDVELAPTGFGINTFAGLQGGSSNVIDQLDIRGNHIAFSGTPPAGFWSRGISLAMSDGCSGGPGIGCSKNNVTQNVDIEGNAIQGADEGVLATDACCGTVTGSTFTKVQIANNVINGVVRPTHLNPWGVEIGTGGSGVSDITINSNSITQRTIQPETDHVATLAGGGVVIVGGLGKEKGSVDGVTVTDNRIDSDLVGISIVGGGPSDEESARDALSNAVSNVTLSGNVVGRQPVLEQKVVTGVKGISVIGGIGGTPPATGHWTQSTGNTVTSVTLDHNDVAGVVDDVFVAADVGAGAYGNTVANVKTSRPTPPPKKPKPKRKRRRKPRAKARKHPKASEPMRPAGIEPATSR